MSDRPVRIIVQQPALRLYRLPFFREWASRDGVSLKVVFAMSGAQLGEPGRFGFSAEKVPMRTLPVGRRKLMWHSAQWDNAAKDRCDVLVLSWNTQYLSIIPALLRARINGIRTILWGHGYSKRESAIGKWLRDAVGRLADALVFYDAGTAGTYLDAGWPESKIYTAPNSLDQQEVRRARSDWLAHPDRLNAFRQSQGLAESRNILYVGRIYEENRLDVLIDALPLIRKRFPSCRLLVIGKHNTTVDALQQQAERLNVSDMIQWLGEIYGEDKIAPYMLSSEIFCYPANIGLSFMHAIGYGVPVVTGDYMPGHNPEIHLLRNGENGALFRHLDAGDLAGTICRLLDDPDRTRAMGITAMNDVHGSNTIERMADGFMKAVKGVIRT